MGARELAFLTSAWVMVMVMPPKVWGPCLEDSRPQAALRHTSSSMIGFTSTSSSPTAMTLRKSGLKQRKKKDPSYKHKGMFGIAFSVHLRTRIPTAVAQSSRCKHRAQGQMAWWGILLYQDTAVWSQAIRCKTEVRGPSLEGGSWKQRLPESSIWVLTGPFSCTHLVKNP